MNFSNSFLAFQVFFPPSFSLLIGLVACIEVDCAFFSLRGKHGLGYAGPKAGARNVPTCKIKFGGRW